MLKAQQQDWKQQGLCRKYLEIIKDNNEFIVIK